MTHVSPDIVCQAPSGRLVGAEAFRQFMGPFARSLTRLQLVASFGDDRTAVLFYDTGTLPVPDAPGAEHLTIANGEIIQMRIIFDRLPFEAASQAARA